MTTNKIITGIVIASVSFSILSNAARSASKMISNLETKLGLVEPTQQAQPIPLTQSEKDEANCKAAVNATIKAYRARSIARPVYDTRDYEAIHRQAAENSRRACDYK